MSEDLRAHWDDLDERYKISQDGHDGNGDYLQFHRCDLYGFETWLSQINFFTKELVAKDLKLVKMVIDDFRRIGRYYEHLGNLRFLLQYRSEALESLQQTGTPQAMKVLCLLLREMWETRITEQPISTLRDLCKLIQNAMKDWESVERRDHWCGHFCRPLWWLRKSRGRGPPDFSPDYGKAFEDLQVIQAEAQKIIAERLAVEQAADPGSFEGQRQDISTENETSEVKKELQELHSANESLKSQVGEMEDKLEKLKQDMLKCQAIFDHQQKMQKELAELKSEKNDFKQKEAQLEQKIKELEQDASNAKEVNEKQQEELLAIKEELGQLKEELQELKLENETMKSRGLEVDGRVNQLEVNNTLLSTQLHDQLQKLEDERLRMKEELVDFKSDKLKVKEELQELKLKLHENLKIKGIESGSKDQQGTLLEYVTRALHELSMQCQRLQLNEVAKTEASECCSEGSWDIVQQDVESSMLHSASSGFSVDTNGPHCFMLDAVFKTPSGAFLSGTDLHLGLRSLTLLTPT